MHKIKFMIMEVKVFLTADHWHKNKPIFVRRFDRHPDLDSEIGLVFRAMKILFGDSSIIVFVCI